MKQLKACGEVLESSIHHQSIDGVDVRIFDLARTTFSSDFHQLMAVPWLSADERRRAEAFLSPVQATLWLQGRITVRAQLAQILDTEPWQIGVRITPQGKPVIEGISFSLSHSSHFLAMASGSPRQSLGIDIECTLDEVPSMTALGLLHPLELKELETLSAEELPRGFCRLWTRKEAYLKALGTGFLRDARADYTGYLFPHYLPEHTTINDIQYSHSSGFPVALAIIK